MRILDAWLGCQLRYGWDLSSSGTSQHKFQLANSKHRGPSKDIAHLSVVSKHAKNSFQASAGRNVNKDSLRSVHSHLYDKSVVYSNPFWVGLALKLVSKCLALGRQIKPRSATIRQLGSTTLSLSLLLTVVSTSSSLQLHISLVSPYGQNFN